MICKFHVSSEKKYKFFQRSDALVLGKETLRELGAPILRAHQKASRYPHERISRYRNPPRRSRALKYAPRTACVETSNASKPHEFTEH